uniref:Multiple epidermal growth factor-like domains protein 9 n=1 Tax=Paramormyrops kingsleyae TaxID=1676925 RepID=A0A3B3QQF6_9TELE|nr:multiple epidermal growth factor-like domains protein 9 [Paramormyrops kingsleyae]
MKCTFLIMFVKPSLYFILIVCIGLYEAAPRVSRSDVPSVGKGSVSFPGSTVRPTNSTTMPNHLPEDRIGAATFFALTPAPTTVSTGTFGNRVRHALTTARSTVTVTPSGTKPAAEARNATQTAIKHTGEAVPVPSLTAAASPKILTTAHTTPRDTVSLVPEKTTKAWVQESDDPQLTPMTDRQGPACNCSGEGVLEPGGCDGVTGQCRCQVGYVGPRCEACDGGYFTNGSTGCLPCDCDSVGSVSLFCDSSGTCACKPGVSGSKCDDCQPGFFRFSDAGCESCRCHNHSSHCHPQSGICLNCQDNTKGPGCEECKYNFYRRPGAALSDVCIPCPCSIVTSTGSCHIDSSGQPVCDQCQPEYEGPNCDRCRDGFYNSDSICLPCDCSGNGDPRYAPRLCDPDTGRCLSCTNHTAGPHCERCAPGYVGDALAQNCTLIVEQAIPTPDLQPTQIANRAVVFRPSGPSADRGMSSGANGTSLPTVATTQALLTSLGSPVDNSTLAEVSWTQFNIVVLAVIIVVVVLLTGFVGGVYTYREYQNRKLNAPFWTIELKEDNISFSSYHDSLPTADVSGLLEDEVADAVPNGQLAITGPMSVYKA